MIRVLIILFFLLSFNISQAQNKRANKEANKNMKDSSANQITIIYIAYEVKADSTTKNVTYYMPRANSPTPTEEMIKEAIRIISEMKVAPTINSSGEIEFNKKIIPVKFVKK